MATYPGKDTKELSTVETMISAILLNMKHSTSVLLFLSCIAFIVVYGFLCVVVRIRVKEMLFPKITYVGVPVYTELEVKHATLDAEGIAVHALWRNKGTTDVVLFFHGNGSTIESDSTITTVLEPLGYSYMLVDYPGYGQSANVQPTEENVFASAQALYDYAIAQGYTADHIVIFGYSLGGAAAIDLSSHVNERATIIMSTFTSTHDVARTFYPQLPIQYFASNQFTSREKIGSIDSRLLLIHGEQDGLLSVDFGRQLFATAAEPKELWISPTANHDSIVEEISTEESLQRIRTFISR